MESPADTFWPVASADGTRVAFEVLSGNSSSIWLAEAGASPRPLCQDCGHPTSWFGNENAMFHATAAGQIALLDISTGASRVVVAPAAGEILGGPDWNPVNQYLIFTASMRGGPKSVVCCPVSPSRAPSRSRRESLLPGRFVPERPTPLGFRRVSLLLSLPPGLFKLRLGQALQGGPSGGGALPGDALSRSALFSRPRIPTHSRTHGRRRLHLPKRRRSDRSPLGRNSGGFAHNRSAAPHGPGLQGAQIRSGLCDQEPGINEMPVIVSNAFPLRA